MPILLLLYCLVRFFFLQVVIASQLAVMQVDMSQLFREIMQRCRFQTGP